MAEVSEASTAGDTDAGARPRAAPSAAQRWLDRGILAVALVFILTGAWLAGWKAWLNSDQSHYYAAQSANAICHSYAESLASRDCILVTPATVLGKQSPVINNAVDAMVTVSAPSLTAQPLTLHTPQPAPFYHQVKVGDPAYLWIWHGRAANLCGNETLSYCGGTRLADSPVLIDKMYLAGGIFALGMGGLLFLIRPPRRLADYLASSPILNRPGDTPPGTIGGLLHQRLLGSLFITFIVLSFLDIATSIWDGDANFFESNPLAVQVNATFGALAGFLAIKLPAAIALALGSTRLPRRIATIVLLAGVAVYVYIVGQNIALHFSTPPPAS